MTTHAVITSRQCRALKGSMANSGRGQTLISSCCCCKKPSSIARPTSLLEASWVDTVIDTCRPSDTGLRVTLVPEQGPYAPQGSASLLPKLSVASKVSARTSCAWVGSRVHFRSSEDVILLEFTSPVDREYMRRRRKCH